MKFAWSCHRMWSVIRNEIKFRWIFFLRFLFKYITAHSHHSQNPSMCILHTIEYNKRQLVLFILYVFLSSSTMKLDLISSFITNTTTTTTKKMEKTKTISVYHINKWRDNGKSDNRKKNVLKQSLSLTLQSKSSESGTYYVRHLQIIYAQMGLKSSELNTRRTKKKLRTKCEQTHTYIISMLL